MKSRVSVPDLYKPVLVSLVKRREGEETDPSPKLKAPEEKVVVPVTDRLLLIVVVPVEAPMEIVVAAPPMFKVVAVVLIRLKVVAVVVKSPPFTAKSSVKVAAPVKVLTPVMFNVPPT